MQDETMVVLAEYNSITEAEIAKSMLDSAGIWSMIRNEYMSAIYPIGTMPAPVSYTHLDVYKRQLLRLANITSCSSPPAVRRYTILHLNSCGKSRNIASFPAFE